MYGILMNIDVVVEHIMNATIAVGVKSVVIVVLIRSRFLYWT